MDRIRDDSADSATASGGTAAAVDGVRPLPQRADETTPEQPWPLRLLSRKIQQQVSAWPAAWIEAQITQLTRRPGARLVFPELRDTDTEAAMSAMVPASVLDAAGPGVREGARVVLRVEPRFYGKRGSLSLFVHHLRPLGEGELLARLEQLKRQLSAEGLFDAERKRPLPVVPRAVGLVCGRGSAAERDVVDNARRRWPAIDIRIRAVAVQGAGAVGEVTAALRALDTDPDVDVVVVARGGGSVEDLLPFSAEDLVRVVAAASTPVVSAIGHEVDTPLLDLVADVRASTPTDAARRIVPDAAAERQTVDQALHRLRTQTRGRVERERQRLAELRSRPALADLRRLFTERRAGLDDVRGRLRTAAVAAVVRARERLDATRVHLRALSPAATLERGYAIVRTPDGAVLRRPADAPAGSVLRITLADGDLAARVAAPRSRGRTSPSKPSSEEPA